MRVDVPQGAQVARPRNKGSVLAMAALVLVGGIAGAALTGGFGARPSDKSMTLGQGGMVPAIAHWFDPVATRTDVPSLTIDMKFRHLQSLRDRRAVWSRSGNRLAADDDTSSATVRYGGQTLNVAVVLAGQPEDVGPTELGRLRITVKGDGELFGMRKFMLEDPERANLPQEALYYAALRRAGLLAPRMQAVQVVVNGKSWGVALAVEQPSIHALATQHRPQGVIVGWDPDVLPGGDSDSVPWLDPRALEATVEEAKRIAGTPLADFAAPATDALGDLMRGKRPADQVVDVAKTARFLAISELWGIAPALQWHSTRWVLHPITLRLEPFVRLPSDAAAGRLVDGMAMAWRLLESPVLRARYEVALREEAGRTAGTDIAAMWPALTAVWPALAHVDPRVVGLLAVARARRVLDVAALTLGPSALTTVHVPVPPLPAPPPMLPLAQTLPFARLDPTRHEVLVPAGEWTVDATVHVPDGWTLRLEAGARMRLASGIWLVVHGPCVADGTLSQPVEITGIKEAGGRAGSWGGVLVVGGTGSRWQHVVVRNASGQGVGAWQPGGAVVWVDGDAVLTDVQVTDTSAPTAAILASGAQFRCDRCTVDRTAGSGIVVEHGQAILNDVAMHDLGGEGVDLTDATAVVRNLVVAQAAGATVRTGQDSDADVLGVQGSRLGNGFVARDGGKLRVAKSRVSEVRHLGFLAYNQRSGDVPAQIDAQEVEVTAAREHHLCTGGAVVKVQGRAQDCTAVSVQQLVAAGIARR